MQTLAMSDARRWCVVAIMTLAIGSVSTADAFAAADRRTRPPRPGDHWASCSEARAAGTSPIYRGEPGCSRKLDRDNDGIACE